MLVALISDTHIGIRSDSQIVLDYCEKFFLDFFFPYLEKYNIKTVIHAGDVFDRRKYVNFNTLQRALLPQQSGTTPLYFILSNAAGEQVINARVRGLQATVDPNYTFGYITAQVVFFCPDPRYYDSNIQTATLNYTPPGGRTYNRIYNLVYGGGSVLITTNIENNGWTDTYPTITLNGPIDNPILGNQTEGFALNFNCSLTNTDSLVVDLYNKLITLNGQPARNLLASGQWFSAQPGTNLFYLTGNAGSTLVGVTGATVTWQSAYI